MCQKWIYYHEAKIKQEENTLGSGRVKSRGACFALALESKYVGPNVFFNIKKCDNIWGW